MTSPGFLRTSRRAVLGKLYRLGELGKRRPSATTPAEKVARPPRNRARRKPTAKQALHFGTGRPKARTAEIDADMTGAFSAYLTATICGVRARSPSAPVNAAGHSAIPARGSPIAAVNAPAATAATITGGRTDEVA